MSHSIGGGVASKNLLLENDDVEKCLEDLVTGELWLSKEKSVPKGGVGGKTRG